MIDRDELKLRGTLRPSPVRLELPEDIIPTPFERAMEAGMGYIGAGLIVCAVAFPTLLVAVQIVRAIVPGALR